MIGWHEIIPPNLRRARATAGLTQQEVAARARMSLYAYRLIETGRREPDCRVLMDIGDVLDVPFRELVRRPRNIRVRWCPGGELVSLCDGE